MGVLTAWDLGQFIEGGHSVQLVCIHLSSLPLGIAGLDLLLGPRDATFEDATESDD